MEKIYAVRKGRNTGLYFSWYECKEQIVGYKGAVFKSFTDLHEASNYLMQEQEKDCNRVQEQRDEVDNQYLAEVHNLYELNWKQPVCFYVSNSNKYSVLIIYKGEVTEIVKEFIEDDNKSEIVCMKDIEKYLLEIEDDAFTKEDILSYTLIHEQISMISKSHCEHEIVCKDSNGKTRRTKIKSNLLYDYGVMINPYSEYIKKLIHSN